MPVLPYSAPILLDEKLPPALLRQLRAHLEGRGRALGEHPDFSLSFTTPEALAFAAGRPAVVFFDGALNPGHVSALVGGRPALLVASRGPEGTLAQWELDALWAYITQDNLVPAGGKSLHFKLQQPPDIHAAAQDTLEFVRAAGGGSYASAAAADVMHELAANALLDAPANPDGSPRYAHRRDEAVTIAPEDTAHTRVVVAGKHIYIQASDRAGRLGPAPIAAAVAQIGGKIRLDVKGGGAGLGMFRLIDQSDLVCFRVARGRRCEATCVLTLEEVRRRTSRPKSLWYQAID